jgi:hypothetical protein
MDPHPPDFSSTGPSRLSTGRDAQNIQHSMPNGPGTKRKKAPTLRDTDWAPYKDLIIDLYASGMTLEKVKEAVEAGNDFRAE